MAIDPLCQIFISTYRKPDAVRVEAESLIHLGYAKGNEIGITDDFNAQVIDELGYSALDVYNELKKEVANLIFIHGPRGGVATNKNRAIWHFLNKSKAKYLFLIDDDMKFLTPGLIEELIEICEVNKLHHVSGMWEDPPGIDAKPGVSGNLWHQDFPIVAQGHKVTWHRNGSHGCANFYTREILEKIGYYDVFKNSFYGYEHALHTARAMRAQGRTPIWHPQHSRAWKFYQGQRIPNRYGGTTESIAAAEPQFWELLKKTMDGIHIKVDKTGLDLKKEVILS